VTDWIPKDGEGDSRLNGAVLAGAATITVNDAGKFPAELGAYLTIWSDAPDTGYTYPAADPEMEIVKVTGITAHTFTVTRAQVGTADVAHIDNSVVGLYDLPIWWTEHEDAIDANTLHRNEDEPAQAVTVAKSGGQYTTIQGAIDSITDAASNKKYVVLVYPGTYTEAVTVGAYISLQGMGATRGQVVVTQSSGTVLTLPTGGPVGIAHINFHASGTATAVALAGGSTSRYQLFNCGFTYSVAGGYTDLITIASGELALTHCEIRYASTGTTTGVNDHRMFVVTGAGTYHVHDCHFDVEVADADDTVYCVYEDTSAEVCVLIIDSEFNITTTGAADAIGFYAESASECQDIQSNHWHLTGAAGGTGTCFVLADAAMRVNLTANRIRVDGFDLNYFVNMGAAATIVTTFDDIVAFDKGIIAGTAYQANSNANGEISARTLHLVDRLYASIDETALANGQQDDVLDIHLNTEGSTGGHAHGLKVTRSVVPGSAHVAAVAAYAGVKPVAQHIGTAAALDAAFIYDDSGVTYTDVTTEFGAAGSDVQIFVDDDDQVLLASASKFDEAAFDLEVNSSGTIVPTFHYITDAGAWVAFTPGDDTSGMTQSGLVRWNADDLPTWGVRTVAEVTGEAGDVDYYWVKITRTKNNLVTPPIENTVQVTSTGDYVWDENGDLTIRKLEIIMLTQSGEPDATDCPEGKMVLWHDSDDAKTYLCVNDGGTVKTTELT